ncbi:MAG: 6,7-dimethyl-8-ribityllumazine synthase [Bdellovibrionaceae bacterium]|nr:6,7-dimethyl-8-ribityllumazine synthase [Pseudobdellovibrionaceae bacterium]
MRVGIVTAEFNAQYTQELEDGAKRFLASVGVTDIHVLKVPGAFELGLGAKFFLKEKKCDYAICLGVVIRGETDHYDFVCKAAQEGCLQVSLEMEKPVAFGVLTVNNYEQMYDRIWGRKGNNGYHVAKAGYDTVMNLNKLKERNLE